MTEDEKKEEAIRLMESAPAEAKKLEALSQQITEAARLTSDMAMPLAQIFKVIPTNGLPPGGWDREISNWRTWHAGAAAFQGMGLGSFGVMSMGSVNSAYTTASMYVLGGAQSPATTEAYETISHRLERHDLTGKAIASMQRLGLDRRGGNHRPALDLLNEAKSAMDRPVVGDGGPVSVLLSLRQSIDAAITELVRRRPIQGPVRGWKDKVMSIGTECGITMPTGHFDKLGADADRLMNELSGAKEASMTRQQIMTYFHRGLLLLNTLMDGIDTSKLRP
jgi:hypothetical protein